LSAELGAPITALSEHEPWFQCNASITGSSFDDNSLTKLSQIAPNLRWLDLGGTAVTDTGLTNLAGMQNLTRLHLERTGIGDEGLAAIKSLEQLEYLNLYGTKVSEFGLENLSELPKLRRLYLWQTQVTPEAAKHLRMPARTRINCTAGNRRSNA
jgi:Leucine-rich repeat (LRR) protein